MKNLILVIAMLVISLMAAGQSDTTNMSDYEKYYYEKNGDIKTSEIKKADVEYDDLYVTSKDQKLVTTVFTRNKKNALSSQPEKQLYSEGYIDGLQDAYDYYIDEPFYYSNVIYRFRYPFSYSWYYDDFWRYPYYSYWNSWYWGTPYYYGYYPYSYNWNYWGYPYYSYNWNYYGYYKTPTYGYSSLGNRNYGYNTYRYDSKSIMDKKYSVQSVSSNRIINNNTLSSRRVSPSVNQSKVQPQRNASVTQRSVSQESRRSTTTIVQKRDYSPTYTRPSVNTNKPLYNNTTPNIRRSTTTQRYVPQQQTRPVVQPRTSNSYSTPSRSSSYSGGSSINKSYGGSSYSGGSSVSRSNSSGSYSRGSSTGSYSSSGGRRK
jgi:hypothetical protein